MFPGTAKSPSNSIYVGGSTPDKRPSHVPSIEKMVKDADRYATALTGLYRPYPLGMKFLERQGVWYTPFNRPGMTGPYDMRSWHERFNQ